MYTLHRAQVWFKLHETVRMFISLKSRSDLKLGHIGLKARSKGQILENNVYTQESSFDPIFINLCQNVCHHEKRIRLTVGHVGSKSRSLGQILEKSCVHSRRHSFDPICIKLGQNVCHHDFWNKFETGSCQVRK